MHSNVNNNPTLLYMNGQRVECVVSADAIERSDNSNIKTNTNYPYDIRKGDIIVRKKGSNKCFATINNLDTNIYKKSESLLNEIEFVGIAFNNLLGNQTTGKITVQVGGIWQTDVNSNRPFTYNSRVQLYVPNLSGKINIDEYGNDGRVTFGIKEINNTSNSNNNSPSSIYNNLIEIDTSTMNDMQKSFIELKANIGDHFLTKVGGFAISNVVKGWSDYKAADTKLKMTYDGFLDAAKKSEDKINKALKDFIFKICNECFNRENSNGFGKVVSDNLKTVTIKLD